MLKRIELTEGLFIIYSTGVDGKPLNDVFLHAHGETTKGAININELKSGLLVGTAFRECFSKLIENNESSNPSHQF